MFTGAIHVSTKWNHVNIQDGDTEDCFFNPNDVILPNMPELAAIDHAYVSQKV